MTYGSCPFCSGKIVLRCRCLRGDRKCESGHEYHYCLKHPEIIVCAESDHSNGGCSCVAGKIFKLLESPIERLLPIEEVRS